MLQNKFITVLVVLIVISLSFCICKSNGDNNQHGLRQKTKDSSSGNSSGNVLIVSQGSGSAKENKGVITKKKTKLLPTHKNGTIWARVDDKTGKLVLTYYGLMLAGAIARSASATAVHPLNVIKIMLQTKEGRVPSYTWDVLSRGAGSQFIMSIPHGAINFVVTESTKKELFRMFSNSTIPHQYLHPCLDFVSSAISTFICSSVSTPQMVLTDRIMAGVYPNFFNAVYMIAKYEGIRGFYKGWLPAVMQKIPSYALTWMFFQHIKKVFFMIMQRAGTTLENTLFGSFAAAGACCIMIPLDTIKTRIVMQPPGVTYYTGIYDCLNQILKHEGVSALYRALPPRLMAVVPMIGIQFGVYELMKRLLMHEPPPVVDSEKFMNKNKK